MDFQIVFLLLMVGLLFWTFSRGRKQQRAQQELLNSLTPGSDVMTTSGLLARIVSVEGEEVVLEVAPGITTRWNRRAVARVLAAPAVDLAADPALDPAAPGVPQAGTTGPDLRKRAPGEEHPRS